MDQYRVTAGVGAFDASMVSPYIHKIQDAQPGHPLKILDYSAQAVVYNLLSNPIHATVQTPIGCMNPVCDAFLLNSALYLSTPWAPIDHPSSPVVKLEKIVSRQFEFEANPEIVSSFETKDCKTYDDNGATLIAIKMCLAHDSRRGGLIAGTLSNDIAYELAS